MLRNTTIGTWNSSYVVFLLERKRTREKERERERERERETEQEI